MSVDLSGSALAMRRILSRSSVLAPAAFGWFPATCCSVSGSLKALVRRRPPKVILRSLGPVIRHLLTAGVLQKLAGAVLPCPSHFRSGRDVAGDVAQDVADAGAAVAEVGPCFPTWI